MAIVICKGAVQLLGKMIFVTFIAFYFIGGFLVV